MNKLLRKGDRVWVEPMQVRGLHEGFFGVVLDPRNTRTGCVHIVPDDPALRDLARSHMFRDGKGEWFQFNDPQLTIIPPTESDLLFA